MSSTQVFNAYPETHQTGMVSIHNQEMVDEMDLANADFGLQVSADGRVWVCINGVAFIRFKPFRNPPTGMGWIEHHGSTGYVDYVNPYVNPATGAPWIEHGDDIET